MVGVLQYFPTEADALAVTNTYGSSGSYTVGTGGPYGPGGGYTNWRLASTSTGSSSQSAVYPNGSILNSPGFYRLYPASPCFLEGTQVLCQVDNVDTYLLIETLKEGTLVKTSRDGYKKIEVIRKGTIQNPSNTDRIEQRLYKCSPNAYPELKDDLYMTGCHSILVDNITDEQEEKTTKQLGKIFVTDKKYRLMACIDERAEPWNSEGLYTIWNLALENADPKMNYGIYVNGGLIVESCCINTLLNKSNMNVV